MDSALAARIDELLPQTQCTRCGHDGCAPYARAVARGDADIDRCPPGGDAVVASLAALLGRAPKPVDPACGTPGPLLVAVIDEQQRLRLAASDPLALATHLAQSLAGHEPADGGVDPRVSRAIAWVRGRLDAPISLREAAEVAHLSPSRFRHLFVAQTGVSFRAYLLWARVETAVGAAMSGQSWTTAAQDAGFADSAHLSRTCRRMFGIAPAALVKEPPGERRAATLPSGRAP